jgi:hypothetical protein
LKTSRDAWNHGKTARIAVSMAKGNTSKETVETRSYDKHFLWANSPHFWVAPRIGRLGSVTLMDQRRWLKSSPECRRKVRRPRLRRPEVVGNGLQHLKMRWKRRVGIAREGGRGSRGQQKPRIK